MATLRTGCVDGQRAMTALITAQLAHFHHVMVAQTVVAAFAQERSYRRPFRDPAPVLELGECLTHLD